MDLETRYDYVTVMSDTDTYGQYTGRRIPRDLHVNGPIYVFFHSDSSGVNSGFNISILKESQDTTTSAPPTTSPTGLHFYALFQ